MSESVIVEVQSLNKHYSVGERSITILKDVTFEIQKGEMVALLGPSGSGKSTLLNLIGLVDLPSEGKVQLGSRDLSKNAKQREEYRRSFVSYVFQQFHLLPQFSALDNVCLPLVPVKTTFNVQERAEKLLARVGLRERMHHLPSELSGGEQQRVAIARSLINSPKVLLCDEPTGNLDTKTRDSILELLVELNREGLTVIIATHDLEVAKHCHYQIEIQDGLISRSQVEVS